MKNKQTNKIISGEGEGEGEGEQTKITDRKLAKELQRTKYNENASNFPVVVELYPFLRLMHYNQMELCEQNIRRTI